MPKQSLQKIEEDCKQNNELPPIPDKLYFTIGEVAQLCDVKTHVLRYWENEFEQLSPSKRRGNRRYYQRKDILLARRIRELLYLEGFTIEGARNKLSALFEAVSADSDVISFSRDFNFSQIVQELESILIELN